MSTKSSSKFWKKLGLGKKSSSSPGKQKIEHHLEKHATSQTQPCIPSRKQTYPVNRPPSIQSQATNTTSALTNNDDDQSIKSKRFSGVLPHRKQSTNSMKRLHQMTAAQADPPALPSAIHSRTDSKQSPGTGASTTTATTTSTTQAPPTPLPSSQPNNTTTLGHNVEQTHRENHVDPSTPPLDSDLGKLQYDTTIENALTCDDKRLADDQPCFTTPGSNMKSCSTDDSVITHSTTDQSSQPPHTTPVKLTKRKSSTSLKKTSKSLSSSTVGTVQTTSKSRLRQPSRTNSNSSTAGSVTPSVSSSSSLKKDSTLSTSTPPLPTATTTVSTNLLFPADGLNTTPDQKDQLIQQLQEALQTEQSINRVLQGQKEAITRDLDYFSLTVDELMEEKEALLQKYEEEKLKSQSNQEDLNVLLDKLKASTDSARDRSMEVDQWKAEIENLKEELASERNELKSALKRKDQEISRLKNELAGSKDHVKALSSRLDEVSQEINLREPPSKQSHQPHSITTIETPSASPRLDALKCNDSSQVSSQPPLPRHNGPSLTISTGSSPYALDDELMTLTKEREKLQSDYSKIPLSGGGPTSRRRKEQLEEMLDEVDSQLSKVKQKIRRS
ncbi:hypothetical protein [Absidia glauca]|uniref:Enkurin domain-containing protein n=1 Tax=Absidia glauca TaxID=4829 RepID=A0A163JMK6_ABSGL|nr:hypothetical protein [Absidia glauca]